MCALALESKKVWVLHGLLDGGAPWGWYLCAVRHVQAVEFGCEAVTLQSMYLVLHVVGWMKVSSSMAFLVRSM